MDWKEKMEIMRQKTCQDSRLGAMAYIGRERRGQWEEGDGRGEGEGRERSPPTRQSQNSNQRVRPLFVRPKPHHGFFHQNTTL